MNSIIEFMEAKQLILSKEIYFTVILGLIALYGVFIPLLQLDVSFSQGEECLGISIKPFCMFKYMLRDKQLKFIRVGLFFAVIVKPILFMMKGIPNELVKIVSLFLIWFWYIVVVLLCGLSLYIINQGIRRKEELQFKSKKSIDEDIVNDFLRCCGTYTYSAASIDELIDDIADLSSRQKSDAGARSSEFYSEIFKKIFDWYIIKKRREIEDWETTGNECENQKGFLHNEDLEYSLLSALLRGEYIELDNVVAEYMAKNILKIIELNCRRKAKKEGEKKERIQTSNELFDLIKNVYMVLSVEKKTELLNCMEVQAGHRNKLFAELCDEIVDKLMHIEYAMVLEKGTETDSYKVLEKICKCEKRNKALADLIYGNMYNRRIPIELVELLSDTNCRKVFMDFFNCYALRGRNVDWNTVSIEFLRKLREKAEPLNEKENLVQYLYAIFNSEFIKEIETSPFDLFSMLVIKICVFGQQFYSATGNIPTKTQMEIIRELVLHEEIIRNENMKQFIEYMRYNNTYDFEDIILESGDSLKSLLLMNAGVEEILYSGHMTTYSHIIPELGAYFLIKMNSVVMLPSEEEEIIWESFKKFNGSVEIYICYLETVCEKCSYPLEYVQKERMKKYLQGRMDRYI